jgi:hypothetical protein
VGGWAGGEVEFSLSGEGVSRYASREGWGTYPDEHATCWSAVGRLGQLVVETWKGGGVHEGEQWPIAEGGFLPRSEFGVCI